MIFAAGLGTRLGAITRDEPKALVAVGGVPILERVARRLIQAGVDRLVINLHHYPEKIVRFVESRGGFGVEVVFSHEEGRPLETGGGLLAAASHFQRSGAFFVHNADVLSEIPLEEVHARHLASPALATLPVTTRKTSRRLLFDEVGLLGRVDDGKGIRLTVREPRGEVRERAFSGIHVLSPEIFELITEQGAFSILDPYLRLAREGCVVEPFDVEGYRWIDIGKPEQLAEAERIVAAGEGFTIPVERRSGAGEDGP